MLRQTLKKLKLSLYLLVILFTLLAAYPTDKANAAGCGFGEISNVSTAKTQLVTGVPCLIGKALDVVVLSSGVVFVIMIFYSGIKLSLSQGDAKGIQGVKLTLTWAVVGFVAVIGVYTIKNIAFGVFGVADTFDIGKQLDELVKWFDNPT